MDDVKILLQCTVALRRKLTTRNKINRPLSLEEYNPLVHLGTIIQENVFNIYMTMKKVFLEQIGVGHYMKNFRFF